MKSLVAALLILSAFACLADGPTTIRGINGSGEVITVNEEYFDYGPQGTPWGPNQFHTVVVTQSGKVVSSYNKQLCGSNGHGYTPEWRFSCRKEGESPLAGATYSFKQELPDCKGYLFVCTQGCSPRAPRELTKDPWECDDPNESSVLQEAACGNPIDEGVVEGDIVNIRNHPGINSSVLGTATKGVRITVLKRDSVCMLINGKEGRWVRVKLHDDNPIKEGWVFDAYIKYEYHSK